MSILYWSEAIVDIIGLIFYVSIANPIHIMFGIKLMLMMYWIHPC